MVSQEVIRGAITSYFAANNALDVEGFVDAFAPNASLYNAGEASPMVGQDAVREVAQQSLLPFQEMKVTMERVFISGNGAAVFYSGHAMARNGRKAHIEGIDVFEINEEGKIQVIRFYLDLASVLALFADTTVIS